jgi:hypothetical protein
MPFDLSLPIYLACGLTLLAVLTTFELPKIQVRTYNKTHGGLHVTEIAFILLRPVGTRQPAMRETDRPPDRPPPSAEFVIYITLKTGNL